MSNQRHKRRESFSILLISNTDRSSRQFNVSLPAIRFLLVILLLLCTITGLLVYKVTTNEKKFSDLRAQLQTQEELVVQLTAEKETLTSEKLALTEEVTQLQQEAALAEETQENPEEEEEPAPDPSYPSRYPSAGSGVLLSSYSEEQPYIAITTYTGGTIVAAGDGTVVAVASDDIYHHIIEVEHGNGYKTRYLCHQEASLETEEGAQVQSGDTLLTVTADETVLDYQVLSEGAPIDPLSVIDARG